MMRGRTWSRPRLAGEADALLLGAGAAHDDGVDGLEVAGVGGEVEGDGFAGEGVKAAGGADVVFDVSAAEGGARVDVLELGEDLGGGPADDVGHDVEAAAMAHAEDAGGGAVVGGGGEELIEKGDEGGEAFEREALGAEVAGLDDLLEEVGAHEAGEDAGLGGRVCGCGRSFELLLEPLPLLGVADVHELDADGGAVDGSSVACGVAFGCGRGKGLGREVLAEGIEAGLEEAPAAEDVEDLLARELWGGVLEGGIWG